MIFSIDAEKTFNKIQHRFMIKKKNSPESRHRGNIRSLTQLCPTLCNPMNCSTPGFLVHHQLLEHAQTHVHRVTDAIQPSHPLQSPSPSAFNLPQHQGLFQCSFQYFILISNFVHPQPAQRSCEKSKLYPFYIHNLENSSEIQILSRQVACLLSYAL